MRMFNIFENFKEKWFPSKVFQGDIETIYRKGKCPDCGGGDFYEGPSGGMATNTKCGICGSFFNVSPFGVDRIHCVVHNIESFPKAKPFNKNMLKWNHVILDFNRDELYKIDWGLLYLWCSDNTTDSWSIKSGVLNSGGDMDQYETVYFKNADDAILFKLT